MQRLDLPRQAGKERREAGAQRPDAPVAHAGSAAHDSTRRSNAAWSSVEKLAGSAMSAAPRRRSPCGAPTAGTGAASRARPACRTSRRPGRPAAAPSRRRTASRSCTAIVVVKKPRSPSVCSYGCFRSAALHCAIRRSCRSASACSASVSSAGSSQVERAPTPGATLVDEDDVAPVVQAREQRHHLRRERRSRSARGRRRGRTPGRAACGAARAGTTT